jgi:beta-glucanase (GH16 family)
MGAPVVAVAACACALAIAGADSAVAPAPRAQGLIWRDEFNGPAGRAPDPRRWRFEVGGHWGAGELQYYTSRVGRGANAALDGHGHLAIVARRETYTGPDGTTRRYTSGRLATEHTFSFAYGRIDARIRVAVGRGLISAFWALGADVDAVGWPRSGEFDVVEVLGSRPTVAWGSIHGPDDHGMPFAINTKHDARVRLDRAFLVDGRPYAVYEPRTLGAGREWTFEHPFFLTLTLSVGGAWAGAPARTTRFPARMLVDWIRVRRYTSSYCPTVAHPGLRDRCKTRP